MAEGIEPMLSQLREHLRHIDRLIVAETVKERSNPRWHRLCNAYDGLEEAINKLEGIE